MLISFSPLTGWTLLLQIELNSFSIKSKHFPYSFQITDMVAQTEFTEWTPDGHLRHSKFVGLREDKEARDVVRGG
jgi:ATP-dependent DNA ligase